MRLLICNASAQLKGATAAGEGNCGDRHGVSSVSRGNFAKTFASGLLATIPHQIGAGMVDDCND